MMPKNKTKEQRGGARKGAGRKLKNKEEKTVTLSVTLSPAGYQRFESLRGERARGEFIEALMEGMRRMRAEELT